MSLKIKTNCHWRNLIAGYDMPASKRAEFDYLTDEEFYDNEFVRYRGIYYDVSEFQTGCQKVSGMGYWDGYKSDSYFSGVVIKLSEDGDSCQVGTYFS